MLTDIHCKKAKPQEKLYRISDFKGLYLEIKPSGVKAWRYRFKLNGKESLFALGEYPSISLAEAREKCEIARKLVKQGINPATNRKQEKFKREKDNANTFEAVALEWISFRDWEEITKTRRLDMLERVVFPSIGKIPTRQVTSQQVLSILQSTLKRGAPTVAAEAKRTMSAIFEFAVATLRADFDPVWIVRKSLPPNKTQHKQALSKEEIGKLLSDFDNHGGNFQTIKAFQLMWLTLTRPNESVQAEWIEFDIENGVWTIPERRMKGRRKHIVPLPLKAIELLRAMKHISGHTNFVFPHRDDRKRAMSDASIRGALNKLGWGGKFSPHATRTTGSTRLNELGFRSDIIEAQLAHIEPNSVRRTYNHATYFEERRDMMKKWSELLEEWKDKVINET